MNSRVFYICLMSITACGGAGKPPVKPAEPDPAQLLPPVLPAYSTLDVMTNRKLARRLAIELDESMNFSAIETAIDDGGVVAGIEVAMASSRYFGAVSRIVGRALGADSARLDDLDAMATSDTALAATLTNQVRKGIAAETALSFEFLMRNPSSSLLDVFSGSASVMSPAVATLWGLSGAPAWSGRSELLVNYADGRPSLGLAVSQSHVSSASRLGGSATRPESRAGAHFISRFRCVSMTTTHDFSGLRAADLSANALNSVKVTSSPCAGCHVAITSAGTAFTGLGRPGGIALYRAFNGSAGATWPGNWYGAEVTSWADLSRAIAEDEAVRACLTQRVFESFVQRPATYGRDIPRLAAIPPQIADSGFLVSDWIREIASSPATTSGPTVVASKVSALEAKVVKSRWMDAGTMLAALAEAAPLAASDLDSIANNLAPVEATGAGEGGRLVLPLSRVATIWDAAQSAASVIVQREFAAGVSPGSRGIFQGVVDPASLSSTELKVVITGIWQVLTGEEVSTSRADSMVAIYELAVNESSSGSAGLKAQDGLAAVLASILTSPYFLSY